MPKFRTLLALLLVLAPTQAFAWGQEGHSIAAEIAQRRLTPTALAAAKKILGGEVSLASVSSWADDVRGPHDHPESYNWHFVDIPLEVPTYDAARDCKADPAKGDCVIAEIGRAEQAMTCGATPAERLDNLRYLIHFVADIHQPMHTVLEIRGENDVDVTVAFPGAINNNNQAQANLHAVWDSVLIQRTVYDWGAYVNRLEGGWLQQNPGPMTDLDPIHWAEEAHPLAKAAVVAEGAVLDQGYYTTQIAVVDEQLGRAGAAARGRVEQISRGVPGLPAPLMGLGPPAAGRRAEFDREKLVGLLSSDCPAGALARRGVLARAAARPPPRRAVVGTLNPARCKHPYHRPRPFRAGRCKAQNLNEGLSVAGSGCEPRLCPLGGRRLLAPLICSRIAEIDHALYAEPFVGMGGVFFRRDRRPKAEVINDRNGDVVNLFRILQRRYAAFMEAREVLIYTFEAPALPLFGARQTCDAFQVAGAASDPEAV